jgi:3-phenylpropionate/cinnamic acid dioxygenase small subunit
MGIDRDVRDAVTDVLVNYATGIDSRDWELFRTCWIDDVDADYGDIGHWTSADEITGWMRDMHDPLGPTMHQLSNIALTADGERVRSRAYIHGVIVTPDGANAVHAFGWYEDELVHTDERWRIARRRFTPAATEMHPTMGGLT